MGKLNIAHHKSYHPYRLDNVERVRRDEAAANKKKTEEQDRALVAVRFVSPHLILNQSSTTGRRVSSGHPPYTRRHHSPTLSTTRQ
ncbi:hypothetical protein BGW80DRAFT_1410979 [Lactifluus volemus]|jgi:N-terminal domain of CBF1 interacting co-repressor CIR|nr:hypothetical protein BGW80DRAFT_1410979 [Lactifluus volemus]